MPLPPLLLISATCLGKQDSLNQAWMPQRPHYLPIQYQRSVLGHNLGLKKQQGTQRPSATSPRSWVPKGQSAPVSDQQWGRERSDSLGVSGGESVRKCQGNQKDTSGWNETDRLGAGNGISTRCIVAKDTFLSSLRVS